MENNKTFGKCESFFSACVNYNTTDTKEVVKMFEEALATNKLKTCNILLWTCDTAAFNNDKIFKDLAPSLIKSEVMTCKEKNKLVKYLAKLTRWDLIVYLLQYKLTSRMRCCIFSTIKRGLLNNSVICAKAMPRQGEIANRIRGFMKLTPEQWRKMLAGMCKRQLSNLMSAGKWDEISYQQLPLKSIAQYYNAFERHDAKRFNSYLFSLSRSVRKVIVALHNNNLCQPTITNTDFSIINTLHYIKERH